MSQNLSPLQALRDRIENAKQQNESSDVFLFSETKPHHQTPKTDFSKNLLDLNGTREKLQLSASQLFRSLVTAIARPVVSSAKYICLFATAFACFWLYASALQTISYPENISFIRDMIPLKIINRAQADSLAKKDVKTVEEIAPVSDDTAPEKITPEEVVSEQISLNDIAPAVGQETAEVNEPDPDLNPNPNPVQDVVGEEEGADQFIYEIEEPVLTVETVLVPQKNTVISSSRDGQIVKINFENGDLFRKGDVLIEYDCRDIKAEFNARTAEEALSRKKALRSEKLFNLEIISDVENLTLDTEKKKAEAQRRALQQRMDSCFIRADYDGRVTNRLANPGEYTRTDRVLMEVSSLDDLEAEFLLPSRWLRWVNIGAPLEIELYETGYRYEGRVIRFHGEVDAASQSIQMTAKLEPYADPLLPGMSGSIMIDVNEIRASGIAGYLESERQSQPGAAR